jgi:hypothetical protein
MDGESVAGIGDPGEKGKESVAGTSSLGGRIDDKEQPASPIPARATDAPGAIDLNAMHQMSPEELVELAKKFGVLFHAARTRHYQILDIARAALGAGLTVRAEGLIDQPGDS